MKKPNNLTPEQKKALEDKIKEITDIHGPNCLGTAIYDYMANHGIEFDFAVNPSSAYPAYYSPGTDRIVIRDLSNLSNAALVEELFHAYQNKTIPGGTATFAGAANAANIEFESKLLRDINTYLNPQLANYAINDDGSYILWLDSITGGGTHFPSSFNAVQMSEYFNFMQYWHDDTSGFDHSNLNIGDLLPSSMFSIVTSSECNY